MDCYPRYKDIRYIHYSLTSFRDPVATSCTAPLHNEQHREVATCLAAKGNLFENLNFELWVKTDLRILIHH